MVILDKKFLVTEDEFSFKNIESINCKLDNILVESVSYLTETKDCGDCPYQSSCLAKGVVYFMKAFSIKDCVLPNFFLDLFSKGLGDRINSFYNWDAYSIENEIVNGTNYDNMLSSSSLG